MLQMVADYAKKVSISCSANKKHKNMNKLIFHVFEKNYVRSGLLKLIKCSCRSEMPCSTNKFSCHSSDMACSPFCACQGGQACQNESGKYVLHDEDEEDCCLER